MMTTQQYVQSILEPHEEALCAVYDRAWERYKEFPPTAQSVIIREGKAIAINIWALVVDEAIKYFFPLGIAGRKECGTWVFPVAQGLVLKFKKTDTKGRTSNYRTPRAVDYDAGRPLVDVPERLRIAVGWVMNENGTGIDDILISMRGPDRWCYSISPNAAAERDLFTFDQDDAAESRPIIRPRHDKDREEGDREAAGDE
jgi:hypothetical protein